MIQHFLRGANTDTPTSEATFFRPVPSLTERPGGYGTTGLTATVRNLRSAQIGRYMMDENIASIGHPSSLLFENPQAAWAVPLYRYRTGKARKEEKNDAIYANGNGNVKKAASR